MVALWITLILLSLLAGTVGALVALRMQYRTLEEGRQERDAWREAQEGRQRTWEVRQAKRNVEVERQLINQIKDLRREWQGWQQKWYEMTAQHQQALQARADLEQELARLPHIEDVEIPLSTRADQQPERWQPPMLYQADLRGRDLSHRYLGRADLRQTNLAGANLYMADLNGATLTAANLEGANLSGANLCGTDLRGANLRGANLLVADLDHALLFEAVLEDTHGLVPEQLHAAIYDGTTSIDRTIYTALAPQLDAESTQPEMPQMPGTAYSEPENPDEPGENESTLRMPLIKRTPHVQAPNIEEHEQFPSTPPSNVEHKSGATPDQSLFTDENEMDTEEAPHNIIQLRTRASKADPLAAIKATEHRKKREDQGNTVGKTSSK